MLGAYHSVGRTNAGFPAFAAIPHQANQAPPTVSIFPREEKNSANEKIRSTKKCKPPMEENGHHLPPENYTGSPNYPYACMPASVFVHLLLTPGSKLAFTVVS
jgi:hypothetical protein